MGFEKGAKVQCEGQIRAPHRGNKQEIKKSLWNPQLTGKQIKEAVTESYLPKCVKTRVIQFKHYED